MIAPPLNPYHRWDDVQDDEIIAGAADRAVPVTEDDLAIMDEYEDDGDDQG